MKKIGRYEIIEELGRGAMGVVYKASDPTIGRLVAIKLLLLARPGKSGLPGVKDIFLREARAAGRLSHPGIVTVHDALEDQETQSCYIVMEFVPGRTLEKALLSGPQFTVEKSLDIARQIAEALEYAHRNKVIHRDLKPANILLTEDERAKITDFGIAKVVATEDAQRTLAIMGTPAYMSPEQVTGGEMDASSDIFSLGILLYLMLTGEKPFSGDTAAVMFKIAYQDPAPPSQVRSELSRAHDFLLLRSLAKDKKKRYATAREFLDDLDDLQHARPPRSEARVPMSELHAGDLTVRASRPLVPVLKSSANVVPKKTRPVGSGVAAGLVVLLAAGFWAVHNRNAPPSALRTPAAPASAFPPSTGEKPNAQAASNAGDTIAQPRKQRIERAAARTEPGARQTAAPMAAVAKELPKPVARPGEVAQAPAKPQIKIRIDCQYELEEATLSLSAEGRSVFRTLLKGRKAGKLFGLRHGYKGTFIKPIDIPAGLSNLTVHIESGDGSINLTRSITLAAANGKTPVLHVNASSKELELNW
jgi:eukaryotic-like serine/threonine-protein kinase